MNELGQRIKQARAEKGLTQVQLAEALYVTRQTISNWENGRSVPDYAMLEQLAKVLPLDVVTSTPAMPPASETSEPAQSEETEQAEPNPEPMLSKGTQRRTHWLVFSASAVVLLVSLVVTIFQFFPAKAPRYTVAWFSQEQAAQEGKTSVRTYSPEAPVKARHNRPEATPIYQCSIFMKEEQGIGCTIQLITLVYFSGNKVTFIDSFAQEDFLYLSLGSPYIGANQCRRMGINFPVGNETGIGFWVCGIDDLGNQFESRYYLPLIRE